MRLKDIFMYIILPIMLIGLCFFNAIINDFLYEQIMSIIVSFFGLLVIEIIRKKIFEFIIDSKNDIINRKIKLISLMEKISSYDHYIKLRRKIISKNNEDYFNHLYWVFYGTYKYDISVFANLETLLNNEHRITQEIIVTIPTHKEKAYRKIQRNFKIISKNLNCDSGFSEQYLKFKNQALLNKNTNTALSTFLSVLTIVGFALTLVVAILKVDAIIFFKFLGIYMLAMLFIESFMGIIYFDSKYIETKNHLDKNIELLDFLEGEKDG